MSFDWKVLPTNCGRPDQVRRGEDGLSHRSRGLPERLLASQVVTTKSIIKAIGKSRSSRFQVAGMFRSPRFNINSPPNPTSCQVCNRIRKIPVCLNDAIYPLAGDAKELCDFSDADEVVTHRCTIDPY